MSRKAKNVALPRELYSAIEKKMVDTGIDSVQEYVIFVMKEVIKDDDGDELQFTQEDDEQVRKKLKELGYLD